jgi:hypothetical protein
MWKGKASSWGPHSTFRGVGGARMAPPKPRVFVEEGLVMRWLCFSLGFLFAVISTTLSTVASALSTVGAVETPSYAEDVAVVGDRAYVADSRSGLRVIDISDPTLPVELGALDTPGYALVVEVVGDLAYLSDGSYGLRIIDVSNPAVPVELGALETQSWVYGIEVVGDIAYVVEGSIFGTGSLRVIDVSDPAVPVEIGALDTPGEALDVEVVGDLAYLVGGGGRGGQPIGGWLRVIDVSNPAFPVELGALVDLGAPPDRPDAPIDVEVVGNVAYMVGVTWKVGSRGSRRWIGGWLRTIDVSNPASPVELAALDMPINASGIRVVEDFAYVADGEAGLRAIGVSDPTAPVERGFL